MEIFNFFRIFTSSVIVLHSCLDGVTSLQFNVTAPSGELLYPGQTFTASCKIWGYPPIDIITNLTIYWKFKDNSICLYGQKMKDVPEKYQCSSATNFDQDSFDLTVSDVSSEDSGEYICEVQEKKKMLPMQAMIDLKVVERTTLSQINEDMSKTSISTTEIPETTTYTTLAPRGGCLIHFQTFSTLLLMQISLFVILNV